MINIREDERLSKLNHSAAHLLAQAVSNLYEGAKFWVGPVIEEGFYYDMDLVDERITEEDLAKIEKEMKKISKDGKRIIKVELSRKDALDTFKDDEYKIDLINNMPDDEVITAYKQGDFIDLCKGPHVDTVKEIKYFKLLKVSGAYFKGDSSNKVLQRVYGIAFDSEEDLENHLKALDERKERDHRKIGKDLEIYMTSDMVGPGLPMWLPNGTIIKREIENYIIQKEIDLGYDHVSTPALASTELYKKSGHWDHYKDSMFPVMKMDDEELVLRPMNCPHHMLVFDNKLHSYKDLPVRIGELAYDYRYEASGALSGLERVRSMCMNDAHLFVREDQIAEEFEKVVKLILEVYKDFNITYDSFRLSLRDPDDKQKYYDNDEMWEKAENTLRLVMNNLDIPYVEAPGEAAFYGPKLDVQVKTALGHEITLSTCQLDFLMPEKFDLTYINESGEKERPVVIHRAITSTTERFVSYLLEETKGALPTWLAPTQVAIIPVNNKYHLEYASMVNEKLKKQNIRTYLNEKEEKVGYKIREAQINKIPFTLVLGDSECKEEEVTYRPYASDAQVTVKLDTFIEKLNENIENKNSKHEI